MIYTQFSRHNKIPSFRSNPLIYPGNKYEHVRLAHWEPKTKKWWCEMELEYESDRLTKKYGKLLHFSRIFETSSFHWMLIWVDRGHVMHKKLRKWK